MANDSWKLKKSLNIEPRTSPTLDSSGDIGVNSTDNELKVYLDGATRGVVTKDQTQTLTNKTLTAPVISTISNTGTLTLPTSTDTLVGRATTDTLTNKTLTAPTIDAVTFDGQASAPSNPSSGFYKVYVDDTTSKLQILDSSGTVTTVGTSAGGINYITNGDAEAATTGWATYADAAGTSPVDGTGGSPTTTFTRSTSSPLRGLGSFLLTKDAANRQGEGASYAFTIADADKAKMMQIDFELEVNSGTYATGDVAVYIVDVTNSTVIQPSGYQVENVGIESRQRMTFQTASNSTSYRLCFHVASTSASAYALKIDTITLGPQVVPLGAPVTDWVSYTPTGTWSTNTTYYGRWRRVGDSAEFQINLVLSGAPTAGNLAAINLPSGMVIDNVKLTSGQASGTWPTGLGTGGVLDDGATVYSLYVSYNTTTSVRPVVMNAAGTYASTATTVSNTVPISFGNLDEIWLRFTVPIVGWSSSTVVSSSADTRLNVTSMQRASNQTGVNPNASEVKINFNDVLNSLNTTGAANTASSRIDIKVPGTYTIQASLFVASTNILANDYGVRWYKNGAAQAFLDFKRAAVGVDLSLNGSITVPLIAEDYVEIYLYGAGNNSASTLTVAASTLTKFIVTQVQGPSQIAASEVVSMLCYKNTGSHTSTGNLQDVASWNAVTKDSHGGFNTTTGIYTCPAPGDYYADIRLGWASNVTGVRQVVILKGSTIVQYSPDVTAAVSVGNHVSVLIPNCVTGDTIKVQSFQSSGGNLNYNTTANSTALSIHRLGGV